MRAYMQEKRSTDRATQNFDAELARCFWKAEHHHGHEASFDLTKQHILDLFHAQAGRCAISDVAFDLTRPHLIPSIDADVPSRGHTVENCHLVLRIVNYAKNSLSTADFRLALAGDATRQYDRPNKSKTRPVEKVVDPSRPLDMSPGQAAVWNALIATGVGATRAALQGSGVSKKMACAALKKLISRGAVECTRKRGRVLYRPNLPVEHSPVRCGCCQVVIPLERLPARPSRSARGLVNSYDTNLSRRTCRACNTESTMRSRKRDPVAYIWSKLQGRLCHERRGGDLTRKDLVNLCQTTTCPVLGLPLTYDGNLSPLQASPDRIRSAVGYTVANTRITSLLVNYARKDFDIADEEVRRILHACRAA